MYFIENSGMFDYGVEDYNATILRYRISMDINLCYRII